MLMSDQSVVMSAQVQHLRSTHLFCAKAAEKAQEELKILRGTCQQLTHDRMQSISNVRKAESEVGPPIGVAMLLGGYWTSCNSCNMYGEEASTIALRRELFCPSQRPSHYIRALLSAAAGGQRHMAVHAG